MISLACHKLPMSTGWLAYKIAIYNVYNGGLLLPGVYGREEPRGKKGRGCALCCRRMCCLAAGFSNGLLRERGSSVVRAPDS